MDIPLEHDLLVFHGNLPPLDPLFKISKIRRVGIPKKGDHLVFLPRAIVSE
jgi:hypothetical protein